MIDSYTMECYMGLHESKTNADRIRSMTDGELAKLLLCNLCESMGIEYCPQDDEFFDESTLPFADSTFTTLFFTLTSSYKV